MFPLLLCTHERYYVHAQRYHIAKGVFSFFVFFFACLFLLDLCRGTKSPQLQRSAATCIFNLTADASNNSKMVDEGVIVPLCNLIETTNDQQVCANAFDACVLWVCVATA